MSDRKVTATRAGTTKKVTLTTAKAIVEDRSYEFNLRHFTSLSASFTLNGSVFNVSRVRVTRLPSSEADVELLINGVYVRFVVSDHRADLLKSMLKTLPGSSGMLEIRAPMPGLVSRIERAPGDPVGPGTGILILEAMKMENEIRSPSGGTLKEIRVRQGQNVEKDEVLAVLESV